MSQQTIRRGRIAAGTLALAGSAALLAGWSGSAEAKSLNTNAPSGTKKVVKHTTAKAATKRIAKASKVKAASYVVKRGDTLSAIAARSNVSVAALASANNMSTRSLLQIGRTISIPGGSTTTTTKSTPTKTTLLSKNGLHAC